MKSGARFAGFTIVRLLGAGAIGKVYLAEQPGLQIRHALKILHTQISSEPAFRQLFARATPMATALHHRHIVAVRDQGEAQGRLWISSDHVDGADIGHLLRRRYPAGMPVRQVLKVIRMAAEALDYAHRRGVLHCGVKPANLLLTEPHDGKRRILLSDFGLYRHLHGSGGPNPLSLPNGDISYVAPEQLVGAALDARADQYALAATAFHLLTGSPPHHNGEPRLTSVGRLEPLPPAVADIHPHLRSLDSALSRALSQHADDRFDSCGEFADALADGAPTQRKPLRAGPVRRTAYRPPRRFADADRSPARTEPQRSRRRAVISSVAVLSAAILAVGAFSVSRVDRGRKPVAPSAAVSSAAAPASSPAPAPPVGVVAPECGDARAVVAAMSVRDKLAQLLMVGVTGAADARDVVTNQHVGGIFIGSWTDLSMLTNGSLADIAGTAGQLPLAVSVDEEGGRVSRLASLIGSAPSARLLAETQTADQVYQLALQRGRMMRKLGITVDFAPVVDVTDAADNTVIGDRSFNADPAAVTRYAGAYARGLRAAEVLPVLKHFPGHGRGSGDSHTGAVVTPPLDALRNDDLMPYRTLVSQAPVGVMVGHLQVPGLTEDAPASLSPAAVDLLRRGSGYGGAPFDGPTFTDDLSSMRAIADRYGVEDAVLRALRAGADVALWVTTTEVPTVLDRLQTAVTTGDLTMANVDASVLRIAAVKAFSKGCRR